MLYVTTQNNKDIYTERHALLKRGGTGLGLYVPYHLPILAKDELAELGRMPLSHRIANILNRFFRCDLSSWDVEFAIGRRPVRIAWMSHRIAVMEAWHCTEGTFCALVQRLSDRINGADQLPGEWFSLAVRIAMLFGVFGDLVQAGITDMEKRVDIAAAINDFQGPMAAWYARKMGLPIGNILCCCNENSSVWEFFHHGQLDAGTKLFPTSTPASDTAAPEGLERLIYECLGVEAAGCFGAVCDRRGLYTLDGEQLARIKCGMYCTVVRQHRLEDVILNVESTNAYRMSPYTALAYCGIQDYRSATGGTGPVLLLSDERPV